MDKRFDLGKAVFAKLFSELCTEVATGASLEEAITRAPSMPEFCKVADEIGIFRFGSREAGVKSTIIPVSELMPVNHAQNLEPYFEAYLDTNGRRAEFSATSFDTFWAAAASEILDYRVSMTRLVVLFNVTTNGKHYKLASNIVLRPFNESDATLREPAISSREGSVREKSVLQISYETKIGFRGFQGDARLPVHDAFRCAIALQEGAAAGEMLVVDEAHGFRRRGTLGGRIGQNPWGRPLHINDDDALQIATVMTRIEQETSKRDTRSRRTSRAIRAFISAMMRSPTSLGEQLIDAWIALEALFGEKRETTFLLAFRIPAFIEVNAVKRVDLLKAVTETYDKRSKYVHGDEIEEKDLPTDFSLQLISRALKRILEDPSPYPDEPREIERRFLTSGTL